MSGRRGNRGGSQGTNQNRPNMGQLLNLERVPALAPKFANKLGKTAAAFTVTYSGSGVAINVESMLDSAGTLIPNRPTTGYTSVTLTEFERRVALANQPSAAERLATFRRKFELRLNIAFPAQGPASGSEADIQSWLAARPFGERRALLLSQKDFEKSYPEGFRA